MTIDAQPGVPPAIAMLLNEEFSLFDRTSARRKLRGMLREMRDQTLAEAERKLFLLPPPDPNPLKFRVFMDGGLDLFGHLGACMALPCRLGYADQVARSVALMADNVWFRDHITDRILDMGRVTNAKLDYLLDDVYLLQRLRPLIEADIAKFCSPWRPVCGGCLGEFEARVERITDQVLEVFRPRMRLEDSSTGPALHTADLYDPGVVYRLFNEAAIGSTEEIMRDAVYRCVRNALWSAGDAATAGGAVFSNSKAGLSSLIAQEGRAYSRPDLTALEGNRAGNLPFIANLSIEQTIALRGEATLALPRLREFLSRHLSARPLDDQRASPKPADYVAELREQAAEVRAELSAAQRGRPSLTRGALGMLSLGVFAYGFAAGTLEPAAGLFQLLTTLGLLHQLDSPDTRHDAQLKSKPGYVLVAAQDLLMHAPGVAAS